MEMDVVQVFLSIVIFAILIEAIVSYGKLIFVDHKIQWQVVTAIIIGVFMALMFNIDLFVLVGFTAMIPYLGAALTGIILSRGSSYVFELIKLISNAGSNTKNAVNTKVETETKTEE